MVPVAVDVEVIIAKAIARVLAKVPARANVADVLVAKVLALGHANTDVPAKSNSNPE